MTLHAKVAASQYFIVHQIRSLKFHLFRLDHGSKATCILALLASAIFFASIVGPNYKLHQINKEIEKLKAQQINVLNFPQSKKNLLIESFPLADQREALLKQIHAYALQQGLELNQITFQEIRLGTQSEAGGRHLAKHQVSLPVQGEYIAIRQWLSALLAEFPTLAVEEFRLRRDSAANPQIEAKIQLALYYADR